MSRIKIPAIVLSLLILTACMGAKAMEVTYTLRSGVSLKDYTVYLVVNDQRKYQELVGPEARERGLFEELRGGRFDLKIDMPNGSKVTMTNLTPVEAVRESVSRKLATQGASTTNQRASAHLTVEITIEQMNIDTEGSDLVARVFLNSQVYRDASAVSKSSSGATSNRIKLIGGTGGASVLSEALSQALNDLDLSGINKY
ncbi:hypothetical protein C4J81_07765 [Deltaproteobacteria bacterium Smac51]|nr:hypothetical protein C4J81_07765 [Deltaproteobacteria bacterium Smac51]